MFEPIIVSRRGPGHEVVIWHGDPEKYPTKSGEIIFAISPPDKPENTQRDSALQDLLKDGYRVERLPDGNVFIVSATVQYPAKLTIYRSAFAGSNKCAPSPPSDASYSLEYCAGNCAILWQSLKRALETKFAQTSSHYHKLQSEKWLVLSGCGVLWSRLHDSQNDDWTPTLMSKGDCLELGPNTEHQLRTNSSFSTVLVMTSDEENFFENGFHAEDHFYVEPPPPV